MPSPRPPSLQTSAPAKVNLTLALLARRADGRHELSSLVAFADAGDMLALAPGDALDLAVEGPMAAAAGPLDHNLVLKAARAAREQIAGLRLGRFVLTKRLPAGAGLGGGSADAGAALRLIAQANGLDLSDPRLVAAACATGADVPVCLEAKARLMHGTGEVLSPPLPLPPLEAVIVFPGIPLATGDIFGRFTLVAGPRRPTRHDESEIPTERAALFAFLAREGNDLELAARLAAPGIVEAKEMLERAGAALVRMTGSGSAFFALYETAKQAKRAAAKIAKRRPNWWVTATMLR